MKPERGLTPVLAFTAIVALLAVGSAAYTVASCGLDVDTITVVAGAGP